jgi:hypothetical protein
MRVAAWAATSGAAAAERLAWKSKYRIFSPSSMSAAFA